MKVKSCNLIKALSCEKDASAQKAAAILKKNKQRRLIVVEEEKPVGILSTTDLSNKIAAEAKDSSKIKAFEVMSSPIYLVCDIEDDLGDIYSKMHEHKSFFVPVTKQGKLHAVLTYGELMQKVTEVIKNGK